MKNENISYEDLVKENEELKKLILEKQNIVDNLRENELKFQLAFENANIGMCLVNTKGELFKVNSKMCEIFGYSKSELEKMTTNDIAHPDYLVVSPTFIKRATSGDIDHSIFEKKYIHKNGSLIIAQVSSSVVRNAIGAPMYFISHVMDITEPKKMEERLRDSARELSRIASLDGLTSIPNRRSFDHSLELHWKLFQKEKIPFSLLLIDIDFFKNYNDLYGHLRGDDCLILVAQLISKNLEKPSDFVGRYGGEEFGVIIKNANSAEGFTFAEHLRKKIEGLGITHEDSIVNRYLTLSIGVSDCFMGNDDNPQEILSKADKALYKAKKLGRNQVVIYSE